MVVGPVIRPWVRLCAFALYATGELLCTTAEALDRAAGTR
jgi:hypothetical protein